MNSFTELSTISIYIVSYNSRKSFVGNPNAQRTITTTDDTGLTSNVTLLPSANDFVPTIVKNVFVIVFAI